MVYVFQESEIALTEVTGNSASSPPAASDQGKTHVYTQGVTTQATP